MHILQAYPSPLIPTCPATPSSILTQELRTPFRGRYSDLMGGTTTSWSTDGAAKVGENQVDTEPHGQDGTHC